MTENFKAKQTLINIPVKDVNASKQFFIDIGFLLNEAMTDANATCFEIGTNVYVALLPEAHFKDATKKGLADTSKVSEMLLSFGVDSQDMVDKTVNGAVQAGAIELHDPIDLDSIYGRSFSDLDGHQWNIYYMKNS